MKEIQSPIKYKTVYLSTLCNTAALKLRVNRLWNVKICVIFSKPLDCHTNFQKEIIKKKPQRHSWTYWTFILVHVIFRMVIHSHIFSHSIRYNFMSCRCRSAFFCVFFSPIRDLTPNDKVWFSNTCYIFVRDFDPNAQIPWFYSTGRRDGSG